MFIKYLSNLNLESDLHEDYDAPGLDAELPWEFDLDEATALADPSADLYTVSPEDVEIGDIFWAEVYQEVSKFVNLDHSLRPFLVISKGYNRVYGFQLTHKAPYSLQDCAVPVEDFSKCGLKSFGYILTNMIRGVNYDRIHDKAGHISEDTKTLLLDKLYDMRKNSDEKYSQLPIIDRLDQTIENVYKIIAR